MRKVKCINGHFFDVDRFSNCPSCGAASVDSPEIPDKSAPTQSPVTTPLLPPTGLEQPASRDEIILAPSAERNTRKVKCINGHFFDIGRFSSCPSCGATPIESSRIPDKGTPGVGDSKTGGICLGYPFPDPTGVGDGLSGEYAPKQESKPNGGDGPTQISTQTEEISGKDSLAGAVEATASKKTAALPKTMAFYDVREVEPPVGWLVCIRGIYTGRAFECKAGRSRIGRNLDMDICLSEDSSISRDVHASIVYEPKKRIFYLQAGASSGLTYHNGNLIFDHEELHAYDKVELGKTEFLFFPLCGEKFTWDDYMEKG